jgi:hypothetical protein
MSVLALVLAGCVIEGRGNNDDGTASQDDTGDGGGNSGDTWRPRGDGQAFLLDGVEDHSLFTLEITGTTEPREGEAYHGWLTGGGSAIYLGEIPVSDDTVVFEKDVGLNAFAEGYTVFQAYASDAVPSTPGEGTILWYGELPTEAAEILEDLLVSSDESDEGSLRAIETTVETIMAYGQSAIDGFSSVETFREQAEAVSNGISGEAVDVTQNGTIETIEGLDVSLTGENGQAQVILDDFEVAWAAFGGNQADKEILEAFDNGYDCVQRIEAFAEEADTLAGTTTVCGAETSCIDLMGRVNVQLGYALVGVDEDENGVIELDEGTIECAIEYASRMMAFDVDVP